VAAKTLTQRDNLLSLVSVAVVVIVLILDIAGDVLPASAVSESLLVVLGLIAVSQIAERELRFTEVRDDLKRMEAEVGRLTEPRFYKLSELPSVLEFMRSGNELFYSGGHLHSLLHNHSNYFAQWLRDGRSLKFLLQDPDNEGLHHLEMPCVNYASKVYVEQIRDSIAILHRLKADVPNARLGVRVTGVSPTQSVAILNGHDGGTEMRILFHLPNGDSSSAPFSRLTHDQDGEWFQLFHERFYKHLWRGSRVIIKHPDED
jgi:hypothetical protein